MDRAKRRKERWLSLVGVRSGGPSDRKNGMCSVCFGWLMVMGTKSKLAVGLYFMVCSFFYGKCEGKRDKDN